jgi:hypothetical protein
MPNARLDSLSAADTPPARAIETCWVVAHLVCSRRGERFERFHAALSTALFCVEDFSEAWCDHIIFLEDFHIKLGALLLFITLAAAAQTPFSGRYVKYTATAGPRRGGQASSAKIASLGMTR